MNTKPSIKDFIKTWLLVFAMTYLNPTSGIVLGAYMIWQNICNALQLSYPKLR